MEERNSFGVAIEKLSTAQPERSSLESRRFLPPTIVYLVKYHKRASRRGKTPRSTKGSTFSSAGERPLPRKLVRWIAASCLRFYVANGTGWKMERGREAFPASSRGAPFKCTLFRDLGNMAPRKVSWQKYFLGQIIVDEGSKET